MYAQLRELETQRAAKFQEIEAIIAWRLGYGALDGLTPEQKSAVKAEAEQAIDQWEETAEMEMPPIEPSTPLQALLREHHEICEQILDIQDEGLGDPADD
jgi:hypothetical protein